MMNPVVLLSTSVEAFGGSAAIRNGMLSLVQ
jgi:hypothetical protein